MSLLDVIDETLIRESPNVSARAKRVTVEVGELSGVVPAALMTAFATAVRSTDHAGCELAIVPVAVVLRCDRCGETSAVATDDLRCARCGMPSNAVVRGRELDIVSIEFAKDGPLSPVPEGKG